jgi:syntaxin 18
MQDELARSSQQAFQIERTVREITTLNQMISTAVMEQAEQIEELYNNAVEATYHVQRGNKDLKKTLALNKSSTLYLAVFMLLVTFIILFMHWFYS